MSEELEPLCAVHLKGGTVSVYSQEEALVVELAVGSKFERVTMSPGEYSALLAVLECAKSLFEERH